MISEAMNAKKDIKLLVLSETAESKFEISQSEHITVSDEVFSFISDEVTPQGAIAIVACESVVVGKVSGVNILLDGISDPGNLGTIFRTAAAVGVNKIFLVNCCDPYSPKTVRSSMSGIFYIDIIECDYDTAMKYLQGITILVADMCGETIFEYNPPQDYCIVIGNEANGVSEFMRGKADKTLKIPMSKNVESLNAGVSLSVMLYELTEGKGRSLTENKGE